MRSLNTSGYEICQPKKFKQGKSQERKGEDLLRRSFTLPYLKYHRESETDYVIREVHEGVCGNHLSGKTW